MGKEKKANKQTQKNNTMNIFDQYLSYGLSVIPCNDKKPAISGWKQFQATPPTPEQAKAFNGHQIACICGYVSGGLICLDFDIKNGNKYDDWILLVNNTKPEILSDIVCEKSPSGGYHIIFRSNKKIPNLKLAINKTGQCTIETRGEGGYFISYPSPNYHLEFGDFGKIKKLSDEDTELLINCAKAQTEKSEDVIVTQTQTISTGLSPFDDYDSRETPTSILENHGWSTVAKRGETIYLCRPGKDKKNISASWNNVPGRFYCFSTSTIFKNNTSYKPSAVYSILEHNGDFSAAAKELISRGYGSKTEKKVTAKIINPSNIRNKIFDIKQYGYKRGRTTGWPTLDKLYSVTKRQFTVITGVPSSGKSEFMDALAINLMIKEGWKFAVFSPENYPEEMHYHKLIEKICGDELRNIPDENIEVAIKTIGEHFFFIDALERDIDLDSILQQTEALIEKKKVDALIIDPWNEIELSRPTNVNDSDFIGNCLRTCRKFARKFNIHLFIIAHPTKLQKGKDGKYPIPELWDIAGTAHWRNKADNGICIHRDFEEDRTYIYVQKIKFKYCGRQGETWFTYEEKSGRYIDGGGTVSDHWSG